MRDYGIVSPKFWTGDTGKQLRKDAPAQVLALYLMTSPHATMIGVYYCPIMYMAHETGLGMEGATKALARLIEMGFCTFDEASETVFVVNMAAYQIGEQLDPKDKRVLGIRREVEKMAAGAIKTAFLAAYSGAFHLEPADKKQYESEAPSEPLPSQDQKQKQKQDQKQKQKGSAAKSRQTSLPDDFAISERVSTWATERGYPPGDVAKQLEAFVSYARRKGAKYAEWDEALMTAIREDWAKVRKGLSAPAPGVGHGERFV